MVKLDFFLTFEAAKLDFFDLSFVNYVTRDKGGAGRYENFERVVVQEWPKRLENERDAPQGTDAAESEESEP